MGNITLKGKIKIIKTIFKRVKWGNAKNTKSLHLEQPDSQN